MSGKQQIGVFKIAVSEVSEMLTKESGSLQITTEDIISVIAATAKGAKKASELTFKTDVITAFSPLKVRGFSARVPADFGWTEFFEPHLTDDSDANKVLLDSNRTYHKSFFVFIYSGKSIYCFSGGLG
jgi:hypothetical protein